MEHLKKIELPKRKNGESASRLIVEFGISNHNVLRQQELKRKPKKVNELSITQEEKKEKETFDLKKGRDRPRQHFAKKRSGKIRGDYDKNRKRRHSY